MRRDGDSSLYVDVATYVAGCAHYRREFHVEVSIIYILLSKRRLRSRNISVHKKTGIDSCQHFLATIIPLTRLPL